MTQISNEPIADKNVSYSEGAGLQPAYGYIEVNGVPGYQAGADILIGGSTTIGSSALTVVGHQGQGMRLISQKSDGEHADTINALMPQKNFAS